ncbi:MAG TPA: nucleoside hydrolase [Candidatus Methylomirabilis sp.]|nr:nucleoside hydrolase [Candidatus Methylomirabilis sp.]
MSAKENCRFLSFLQPFRSPLPTASTVTILILLVLAPSNSGQAQKPEPAATPREKIIIDTDIGDDIDDAFAVTLALRSPELQILDISTTFGDTEARAKILDRMLGEAGRTDIPVLAGVPTHTTNPMTQRRYGESGHFARASHSNAADFILEQIRRQPGQITLVAIGPLVNVGALIAKDPQTFLKLKRVVMMGGSIERGYGDPWASPPPPPSAEWNIINDIPAAQKLFLSGVPLYVMPLDSTQLKLDEVKRAFLFRQGTPLTDALTLLYHQWGQQTPTLFDPMTVAAILNPKICPVQPMHIRVDDKGFTRAEPGAPNAQVCLYSDEDAFFHLLLGRLTHPKLSRPPSSAADPPAAAVRFFPTKKTAGRGTPLPAKWFSLMA